MFFSLEASVQALPRSPTSISVSVLISHPRGIFMPEPLLFLEGFMLYLTFAKPTWRTLV